MKPFSPVCSVWNDACPTNTIKVFHYIWLFFDAFTNDSWHYTSRELLKELKSFSIEIIFYPFGSLSEFVLEVRLPILVTLSNQPTNVPLCCHELFATRENKFQLL